LFVAITAPINYLAIPAIARIRDHGQLRRRMVLGLGTATLVAACVVVLAHLLPSPFLWLLGGNYGHLTVELPLALAAQGLSMVTALAWALVLARGWVKNAWITILTTLAGFAIGAALFPLGTVAGMLKFNTVVAIPTLVFCLGVITSKLARSSQAPDSLDL
jgi:hypothetical protein